LIYEHNEEFFQKGKLVNHARNKERRRKFRAERKEYGDLDDRPDLEANDFTSTSEEVIPSVYVFPCFMKPGK
jgi:hypothetical protein